MRQEPQIKTTHTHIYIYIYIYIHLAHKSTLFIWLMVEVVGHVFFFFFFLSDSRVVSHSHFACNWQTRFWDSEPVVTRFPSNTRRTSDIQIPCNSKELHPIPCMRVVCRMHGLGLSRTLKQNVLSLFLLISFVELTNQKEAFVDTSLCTPYNSDPCSPMMVVV